MKNARAKLAKILFFIVKYAGVSIAVVVTTYSVGQKAQQSSLDNLQTRVIKLRLSNLQHLTKISQKKLNTALNRNNNVFTELPFLKVTVIPICHGPFDNSLTRDLPTEKVVDKLPNFYDFDPFDLNILNAF